MDSLTTMPEIERLGTYDIMERDLFLLSLDSPEGCPANLALSSHRFACLLAWDASGVGVERIAALARKLLDAGAVYICAWGPDCERVHDIIDEEEIGPDPPATANRVVMTTWHSDEPLAGCNLVRAAQFVARRFLRRGLRLDT